MKKTALIALFLILALGLTGCGAQSYSKMNMEEYVALGSYKGLSYTPIDTTVSDYALTVAVHADLEAQGYKDVDSTKLTSGTVQVGDTCNIDYKGLKDGVAFSSGTAKGASLTIGSGQFIAGFEEGLVGVKVGEQVSLNLTFPKNYGNAELAGQAVVFEVTINSITKRKTFPEITDAIANAMDEDAKTVSEYYSNKKAVLEEKNKAAADKEIKETLWGAVVTGSKLKKEVPQNLVKKASQKFTEYYEMVAIQSAYDSLKDWATANGMTMEYFEERANAYGLSVATGQMVAYAIAAEEGFSVSEELFNETAKRYASSNGFTDVNKYVDKVGKEPIRDQVVMDYAVQLVLDNAVVK